MAFLAPAAEDMPDGERKRCYAWLGRRLKNQSTNPALLAKCNSCKNDADRCHICNSS